MLDLESSLTDSGSPLLLSISSGAVANLKPCQTIEVQVTRIRQHLANANTVGSIA